MPEFSGHGVPWIAPVLYMAITSSAAEQVGWWGNLLLVLMLDIAMVASVKLLVRRKRPSYNRGTPTPY